MMEELKKDAYEKTGENDGEEPQGSGIAFVTLGYSLRSGKMVYANPHADTEEGRAFLLLCAKKIMRKRDFQRYLALSRRRAVKK